MTHYSDRIEKIGYKLSIQFLVVIVLLIYFWIALYEATYTNWKQGIAWIFHFKDFRLLSIGLVTIVSVTLLLNKVVVRSLIHNKNQVFIGLIYGLTLLLSLCLTICVTTFFIEGFKYLGIRNDIAINKMVKPFLIICVYGLPFFLLFGILFTKTLKSKLNKTTIK